MSAFVHRMVFVGQGYYRAKCNVAAIIQHIHDQKDTIDHLTILLTKLFLAERGLVKRTQEMQAVTNGDPAVLECWFSPDSGLHFSSP